MTENHRSRSGAQPASDSASTVTSDGRRTITNNIPFGQRLSCTISEACAATGLGRTKLYELIGAGSVDTTLIGRRRLVSVKSLSRLIGHDARSQPPD